MIFILGVGRSGTSLLQSILNSHSRICFLPETKFLRSYVLKKNFKITKSNYKKITNQFKSDKRLKRLKIDLDEALQINNTMYDIYHYILETKLINQNKSNIGDKDPKLIEKINRLHHFFPNSKIIHIIRDPRDVVLSRTKAKWSQKYPFYFHAIIYYMQLSLGIKSGRNKYKENYIEVLYENLIKNPDYELSRIIKFLNLDFEKSMLDFKDSSKQLVSEDELEWKKETFLPIKKNNFNKWKLGLTNFQIFIIESICFFYIKKFNYKNEIKFLSFKMLFVLIIQPFLFLLNILYRLKLKC